MITKELKAIIVFVILMLASPISAMSKDADEGLEWVPFPVEKVSEIINSTQLTDVEKVTALTRQLDRRISLAPIENPPGHKYPTSYKPDPTGEYAGLIKVIAKRNSRTDSPGRPEAVQSVLDHLDAIPDIANKRQVHTYLHIALAYAGGNPPESELLNLLNDQQTSPSMIVTVLEAMQHSDVPVRALPKIIELASHSWNYVTNEPGIGPDNPRRVYPIRKAAYEALSKLDINVKILMVEDQEIDSVWKTKLKSTVIQIDHASLVARLRDWLLSPDEMTWRAAADIVHQIPGEDVQAMFAVLLKENKLSEEKKQVLEQAMKMRTQEPAKAR